MQSCREKKKEIKGEKEQTRERDDVLIERIKISIFFFPWKLGGTDRRRREERKPENETEKVR